MLSSLGTYDFTDYSNLLTKVEETDAKVSELGSELFKRFDLNIQSEWKIGYELAGEGIYLPSDGWISSGNLYVENDLYYESNASKFFCYDSNGTYIDRVFPGNPLLEGTAFVRINWKSSNEAPYFVSSKTLINIINETKSELTESINETKSELTEFKIKEKNQNIQSEWKVGYELAGAGIYSPNADWISSGNLYVEDDLYYESNASKTIFCYDSNGAYIDRVSPGNQLIEGTAFVRINWKASDEAPYFVSSKNLISIINETKSELTESINKTKSELTEFKIKEKNQNIQSEWKVGYELAGEGIYSPSADWISSGNLYVEDDLYYESNASKFFCYDSNGTYIDRVFPGDPLLEGTAFVRINWKASNEAPYFVSSKNLISIINETKAELTEFKIKEKNQNIQSEWKIGYELAGEGIYLPSDGWISSGNLYVENDLYYESNTSKAIFCYDSNGAYIDRVYSGDPLLEGTAFVRINWKASDEAPYFVSSKNLISIINETKAELTESTGYQTDKKIAGNLKPTSSSLIFEFTTNRSIYKLETKERLLSINGLLSVDIESISVEDSYYADNCKANIIVTCGSKQQSIPLRINNYGVDLFSIRARYPIVNSVENDGSTHISKNLPIELESCYLSKTSEAISIHYGDDSILEQYVLSQFSDVASLVDAIIASTTLSEHFVVEKYGCEGVTFEEISNFDKIYLVRQHTEYLYQQGDDIPTPTGETYWDSYPTMIKTNDVGFKHHMNVSYKVVDGYVKKLHFSLDGMFVRFETSIELNKNTMSYNSDLMDYATYSEYPYTPPITPLLSMQHWVVESDNILGQNMKTTTYRLNTILSYLSQLGFVGQSFQECLDTIRGINKTDVQTYCLTFDDYQKSLWTNEVIRKIFNKYNAKPTLVYIINGADLGGDTPPNSAPTQEEYKQMKSSGWNIIPHGFTMYISMMSYAQFVYGFSQTQKKWIDWYGECPVAYNAHGDEPTDYQYYILRSLGFNLITSGSAPLGWYCEAGTTINIQYKRITWLDSEDSWGAVKSRIDQYIH